MLFGMKMFETECTEVYEPGPEEFEYLWRPLCDAFEALNQESLDDAIEDHLEYEQRKIERKERNKLLDELQLCREQQSVMRQPWHENVMRENCMVGKKKVYWRDGSRWLSMACKGNKAMPVSYKRNFNNYMSKRDAEIGSHGVPFRFHGDMGIGLTEIVTYINSKLKHKRSGKEEIIKVTLVELGLEI